MDIRRLFKKELAAFSNDKFIMDGLANLAHRPGENLRKFMALSLTLSSDLRKANSTLDKTTKMRYNAQVCDCTLTAEAIGVSQE